MYPSFWSEIHAYSNANAKIAPIVGSPLMFPTGSDLLNHRSHGYPVLRLFDMFYVVVTNDASDLWSEKLVADIFDRKTKQAHLHEIT